MTSTDVREKLVHALGMDLIGPIAMTPTNSEKCCRNPRPGGDSAA